MAKDEHLEVSFLGLKFKATNPSVKSIIILMTLLIFFWATCNFIAAHSQLTLHQTILMKAMNYEYLIRRVYQCGRDASRGANADIYRKLEHAEKHITDSGQQESQEQKEYAYRTAFAGVKYYLGQALREGLRKIERRLSKQALNKMEDMQSELRSISFYDKKRLDEIIVAADDTFHKNGLNL